jgi:hypothetical protein
VARFAARGAGRRGMPPALAPLADPRASPADSLVPAVDAALSAVVAALLQVNSSLLLLLFCERVCWARVGRRAASPSLTGAQIYRPLGWQGRPAAAPPLAALARSLDPTARAGVQTSLVYLRDRVGVPRGSRGAGQKPRRADSDKPLRAGVLLKFPKRWLLSRCSLLARRYLFFVCCWLAGGYTCRNRYEPSRCEPIQKPSQLGH